MMTASVGGKSREESAGRTTPGVLNSGGSRGDVPETLHSLFLASKGVPGEEVRAEIQPEVSWISVIDGTRTPPDLEDRAGKFLPQQNMIIANGDFRVFVNMVDRWCRQYSQVPGARETVQDVVREWFEQQLIETVLGVQALRDARSVVGSGCRENLGEEALTAAVMPRYHIDIAVKRALGAKLGTLKEKAS